MSEIEWGNPPASEDQKLRDEADNALRSRPGEWAKIATTEGVHIFPWWGYFFDRPEYETRSVSKESGKLFGKRDIYARYVGD